jgi:putative tricarboxylic transport membrane protein
MTTASPNQVPSGLKLFWLRQDAAGGLVLIAVALLALGEGSGLPSGTLGAMGSGMMPRVLGCLLGGLAAILLASAFFGPSETLQRWSPRGPALILGAVVVFGLCVRPLGLAVAGPLAIIVGACASDETKWFETLLFSVAITGFCIVLFKFALGLAIPLAPWLIGY